MRRKETRPTTIYWLFDTRTGVPFYCGKTVALIEVRFKQHMRDVRKGKSLESSLAIVDIFAAGGSVVARTVEIVPPSEDWVLREKHWIGVLRHLNPAAVNVCSGGNGAPGWKPSKEWRAAMSARTRAYWADPIKGPLMAERVRAALSTPESEAKRLAGLRASHARPEWIANNAAGQKSRWAPKEVREKASIKYKEVWTNPKLRENASQVSKAHWATAESRDEQSRRMISVLADTAVKANASAAQKARRADPADRARTSQAMKAYWERRKATAERAAHD